jgi:aminoglycoside phosphotransferase (APT) family kinase protein
MNETVEQVWIIPGDPSDMAPLPVLRRNDGFFAAYDRKTQTFGQFAGMNWQVPRDDKGNVFYWPTFEECRAAMLAERSGLLEELNAQCRRLAASIEHTRTIPTATFPNVQREVREEQEQQGQEKAQAEKVPDAGEKVKPALTQPPSRKTGSKVEPKTPIA